MHLDANKKQSSAMSGLAVNSYKTKAGIVNNCMDAGECGEEKVDKTVTKSIPECF